MKLASRYLLVAVVIVGITGCSNFRFPGVHKINIQQGHIITEEMVSQLQVGQTKRQVRFVLGTSLLAHTFDDDRWDYYYSLRRGADGRFTQHLLSVYFENDQLARWEGDHLPGAVPMSGDKSERYLEDAELNSPLPTNIDEPAAIPEDIELEDDN